MLLFVKIEVIECMRAMCTYVKIIIYRDTHVCLDVGIYEYVDLYVDVGHTWVCLRAYTWVWGIYVDVGMYACIYVDVGIYIDVDMGHMRGCGHIHGCRRGPGAYTWV